jgi:large subunit ribosomal protein L32
MAHPKRKTSKQRKNKRRTHYKLKPLNLSTCSNTNQMHLSHKAFWYENKLYYNGKIVMVKKK